MTTRTYSGVYANLAEISNFVVQESQSAGFNEDEVYAVQLAVDEACTNVIEHGYGGEGIGDVQVTFNDNPDHVEILIEDQAPPFDPDTIPEPKVGAPLEELGSRGAGIFLIRKIMDEVSFEFKPGNGTVLKMIKKKST